MDSEDILTIPLSCSGEKDEIIWSLDSKGTFSVKSSYQLAQKLQNREEASGSNEMSNGSWGKVWKLNILPRAKICLWKILNNFIPTKSNLNRRGMDINPLCLFCRKATENSSHIFWRCKKVRIFWESIFPNLNLVSIPCREDEDMLTVWDAITKDMDREEVENAAILLWSLWNCRNKARQSEVSSVI